MRGQLPKAYLRIDPDLPFTHPDPGSFLRLLSVANKQPYRGRFREWCLIEAALGRAVACRLQSRGDVIPIDAEGKALTLEQARQAAAWYVPGWDEWQEGDLDVGERMRRMRERRRNGGRNGDRNVAVTEGVTPASRSPSQKPSPPSEASRRQGVRRSSRTSTDPPLTPPAAEGRPPREGDLRAARDRLVAWAAEKLGMRFDRKQRRELLDRLRGGETEAQVRSRYEALVQELEATDGLEAESAAEAWSAVLHELSSRIEPEAWTTWFAPSKGVHVDADSLTVQVPSVQFVAQLGGTYGRQLSQAMTAAGLGERRLELVPAKAAAG